MSPGDLLADALGRVVEGVEAVLDGLDVDELAWRPAVGANSIAWLVWHLTRVYDDHVAAAAGRDQVHVASGYAERFALPLERDDTGFGHSADDAAAVRAPADLLAAYLEEVHRTASAWIRTLDPAALDRVVDERWDPPVTLGVRLVSVLGDCTQHVGQAAYVRGLLDR
ncbi:DinB superfamily protein [Nocardioides dokdonensis FR1436]|uniref:DinB superfamily protein n=1 Tax=Nocardioides dokdonensis FR1436 TaxID=1300347 RepID=A0A1A9GK70_9ACTN|nr:DUF664 domain-containing protein [Nocardioides dokdonensis]ANH37855.1 DinB superfamily protein [Nocardioides dokdonensis FR1436]